MINSALGDPTGGGDLSLKDGRALHMVKLVAAVRNYEERSTNVFIDVEDGTGFTQVKVWVNKGDESSAIAQFRKEACTNHTYIRIIGQIWEFDGQRQVVANDVRLVSTGNKLTYHLLEVANSYERGIKMQSQPAVGGGMGFGIGNMASNAPSQGGMGVGAQGGSGGGMGGGSTLNDAVIDCIKVLGSAFHLLVYLVFACNPLSFNFFSSFYS